MNTPPESTVTHHSEEQRLIAAILAGDRHRYHELVRPVERKVFMVVLAYMKNTQDAEDIVQEAFLAGYRNLASFRGEARFSSWITTIALNLARARQRKAVAQPMLSLDEPDDDFHPCVLSPALLRDWREIPSEALERAELRTLLRDAVAALPEGYRAVFLLREFEQLSGEETATALGITHALVKVRLHRARIMLQKTLAPQLRNATPPHPKRRWLG